MAEKRIPVKLGMDNILDSEFSNIRERFDAEMKKMEEEMSRFRSELMNRESAFFKTTSGLSRDDHLGFDGSPFDRSSSPFGLDLSGGNANLTSSSSSREESRRSEVRTFIDGQQTENRSQSSYEKSSTTSSTQQQQQTSLSDSTSLRPDMPSSRTWLESLNSPLIQDEGDQKMLKLRFDVSQYVPEEIVVKTVDNKLLVHAKHEEKSDTKSVYREYNREFLLPKGTNPEAIRSSLSKDGVLTVEAPLPALVPAIGEKLIPISHH